MERIIYIRRVEKNNKSRLPKDLLMDSRVAIGASFNKFGKVLKGLTGEEEEKIMPEILGTSLNSPDFGREVERFWHNISIKIPPGMGAKLNVAVDNGKPVAPLDYAKYKYATQHRRVASEDKVDSDPYAMFYIHDPASETEKQIAQLGMRNKAKLKYLELIQDETKMDSVLSVLTSYKNPLILEKQDKELILEKVSTQKPDEFIAAVEDDKLTIKSFIYRCITAGVFKESGTRIIYDDNIIGEDLGSAVAYLKSKQGSGIYAQAEGKLHQWALKK